MLVATFSLPHHTVALDQSFQELPELEVEAERIVAHSRGWVMSGLWAANTEFECIDEVLAADPTVNKIIGGYEFVDAKYYLLDWTNDVNERIDIYIDQRTSILDADADADSWQIRIRFFSRDQFDTFRHTLNEEGIAFQLHDLTEPGAPRETFGDLTPDQRDALVVAWEFGYFEIPRQTTTREIAAELEISHQALSERLRRGITNLVGATLTTSDRFVV